MFSKKAARRYLQSIKKGCTVKEFLNMCGDMGALCPNSALTEAARENGDII